MYTLTGKPNSVHDSADGEEDGKIFIEKTRAKSCLVLSLDFSCRM